MARSPRPVLSRTTLALALSLAASPLAAQAVDGKLVEEGSRAPVARALVALVDADGRAVATAQTGADGAFVLSTPTPGTYRVRAERVGRAATFSAPMALAAGERRALEMAAVGQVVMLEGIVAAAGERACSVRPDGEARVAAVWEEARKALEGAEWSRRHAPRTFTIRAFSRELEPASLTVRGERSQTTRARQTTPFRSVPAAQLAQGGYVTRDGPDNVFFAPDAEVLLSDAFLDTHCFRLQPDDRGRGLVGLAFEPVRGRRLPDVRGVMWLDARSAELRRVEYAYTEIGPRADNVEWGGHLDFARLPDGAWYVSRWTIRMPVMGTARSDGGSLMTARPTRLVAVKEDGAEVADVAGADGQTLAAAPRPEGAGLVGVVYDSTRSAALAGARVFLQGTPYEARSDAAGAYRLENVPEGLYTLAWEHPRADSLVIVPAPRQVELRAGRRDTVALALAAPPRPPASAAAGASVAAAGQRDSAIALAAVEAVASATRRRLENAGFYDRRRVGSGVFMTTDSFVKRNGARVMDRINGLRGTYLRPVRGNVAPQSSVGMGDHWGFFQYQSGHLCFAPLWIDGARRPVRELERIAPQDVEAIEVYSGDEVPMRFVSVGRMGGRDPCGAVVVWLKKPST